MLELEILDHVVPPEAIVKEVKQCENCSNVFVRNLCAHNKQTRCGCVKYCAPCRQHLLTIPPNEIEFNAMLGNVVPHLSKHAIHYDEPPVTIRQRQQARNEWMPKLLVAFGEHENMTARQICDVIGLRNKVPTNGVITAKLAGFDLVHSGITHVGFRSGRGQYLYSLRGVSLTPPVNVGRRKKTTAPESIYL